jgi:hypothetical protein
MEIRVVGRQRPPVPQKESGGSIATDPLTGDLVVESPGAKIRLANRAARIHPLLDVTVTEAGPATFRYDYQLADGNAAKRQISSIGVDVPYPERISTKTVEPGWGMIDIDARPCSTPGVLILKNADDTVPRLKPGQRLEFSFSSPDLPGLSLRTSGLSTRKI